MNIEILSNNMLIMKKKEVKNSRELLIFLVWPGKMKKLMILFNSLSLNEKVLQSNDFILMNWKGKNIFQSENSLEAYVCLAMAANI